MRKENKLLYWKYWLLKISRKKYFWGWQFHLFLNAVSIAKMTVTLCRIRCYHSGSHCKNSTAKSPGIFLIPLHRSCPLSLPEWCALSRRYFPGFKYPGRSSDLIHISWLYRRGISCTSRPGSHCRAPLFSLGENVCPSLVALVSQESLWLEGAVLILGISSFSGGSWVKRCDWRLFETGIPDPESCFSLLGHIWFVFQWWTLHALCLYFG